MTPKRQLGMLDATMIIMGSMIGSGIFLAPALIAQIIVSSRMGSGSFIFLWIVGGLLTLCAALSLGELASSMPHTGGQYVYLSRAFSPLLGYLYGWTQFSVIQSGFIAAVAIAFANYLGVFIPSIRQSNAIVDIAGFQVSAVQAAAIALILALSLLNSRGLRAGAGIQNALGIAKIAALAGIVVFGITWPGGSWSHLQPLLPETLNIAVLSAFAVAMSKALFAYDSWNVVTFVAEEARDPARLLPRALLTGTLGVTLIYTLAAAAYIHVLPVDQAAAVPGQRIAADVAQLVIGPIGLALVAAAILISTAGCDNGLILSGPWLYYAMAKDGLFFEGATRLDEVRRTPVRSLIYQAVWCSFLVLSGSFGSRGAQLYSDLLTFTAFASLLFNTLTVIGLFVMRRKEPALDRPFRVPGYPFTPILFLAIAAFFLVFIAVGDPRNSGIGLLMIAAGLLPYLYWRRAAAAAPPAPSPAKQ